MKGKQARLWAKWAVIGGIGMAGLVVGRTGAAAREVPGYVCAPQQLLMGRWSVTIVPSGEDYVAKTSYLANLYPGAKPITREIAVTVKGEEGIVRFNGDRFKLSVRLDEPPKRNPFLHDRSARAATLSAHFTDGVFLKNRPYACKPTGQR